MDIKKLFDNFDGKQDELNIICRGFENSPYYCNNLSLNNLFKDLIIIFSNNDRCLQDNVNTNELNILTGGLRSSTVKRRKVNNINKQNNENNKANNEVNNKDNSQAGKTMTFTSDLKIVLNNIVGLMGYEFATCLITLINLPSLIDKNIKAIEEANNYKEIYKLINVIANIFKLQNGSIFRIKEENGVVNIDTSTQFDANFTEIYRIISHRIKHDQNIKIKQDKERFIKKLTEMKSKVEYDNIYIKTIDNLCINLDKIKPCYSNYFLKIWEQLFKETYADYYEYENIYPKFDGESNEILIPYAEIIQKYINKMDSNISLKKYTSQLVSYFNKIFRDVITTFNDNIKVNKNTNKVSKNNTNSKNNNVANNNNDGNNVNGKNNNNIANNNTNNSMNNKLNVELSDQFYEHLAAIAMNLLICLAKQITISQAFLKSTSNSVRLQFIQLFNGLRYCVPTLMTYNESQLYILHYILLTSHVLTNSKEAYDQMDKTIKNNAKESNIEEDINESNINFNEEEN